MHSINPVYLTTETQAALRKQFRQNKRLRHIALGDFLTREELARTRRLCARGWKKKIIPDRCGHEIKKKMILNGLIGAFAKKLLGKPVRRGTNRRFGHRDYTMREKKNEEPCIVTYLFPDDWNQDWGGNIVFVKAGTDLGRFTPRKNTLLIVERKDGVRSFVKYVNHRAKNRKLTILS